MRLSGEGEGEVGGGGGGGGGGGSEIGRTYELNGWPQTSSNL